MLKESKPQRSRRERGRRQHAIENVVPESALPSAEAVPPEEAKMHSNPVFAEPNHDSGSLPEPSAAQVHILSDTGLACMNIADVCELLMLMCDHMPAIMQHTGHICTYRQQTSIGWCDHACGVHMQAKSDQQVPIKRGSRIGKLKTMVGTLYDLRTDLCDPITQVNPNDLNMTD